MARNNSHNLKVRISRLVSLKCTGTPAELATRLEISERSVKRIISELRKSGNEIRYCPIRKSYVTDENYQ